MNFLSTIFVEQFIFVLLEFFRTPNLPLPRQKRISTLRIRMFLTTRSHTEGTNNKKRSSNFDFESFRVFLLTSTSLTYSRFAHVRFSRTRSFQRCNFFTQCINFRWMFFWEIAINQKKHSRIPSISSLPKTGKKPICSSNYST